MRYESKYDYLQHYGVKGQKHGLRRFQNEDGSLTAEGREHYGVGEKKSGRFNGISSSNSTQRGKEKRPSNQNEGEAKAKKNHDRAKKILAVAAAASLTAVAAYAASKAIKSKASTLLGREQARDTKLIMLGHDRMSKNIGQDQHYDYKVKNDLLEQLRQHTNAELSGTNKYYDSKRESMSRSTRESLRYIRGEKGSSSSNSSARSDSQKRTTSSSSSPARSESPKRTTSSNAAANERAMRNLEELRRLTADREARMNRLDESLARANQAARGGSKKKRHR